MNNLGVIGQKVGTRVGDTSATFLTTINQYINDRYFRIFKKFNFATLVPGYSFATVIGTQDYVLPSDFKHEIYVYDSTNLVDIPRIDLQEFERIYASGLANQGTVSKCVIFNDLSTASPAVLETKIRFYQIPGSVITVQMPYIKQGAALVNSTDLPIIDMSDLAAELGATADAWRTKRQFQKAADFEVQYERVIMEMIWEIENDPNRVSQFRPRPYNRDDLYGGDGTTYYGYNY